MKWAAISLRDNTAYKDADGARVDMRYIGEPDSTGCSFLGTHRDGSRRFYRADGSSPDSPGITQYWPVDEPDRYYALHFDAEQEVYHIRPPAYADGGMFRKATEAKYGIKVSKNEDKTPSIELIEV